MAIVAPAGCLLAQPAGTAAERADALAAIRAYALNFIQGLPDFTCTQTAHWTSEASITWGRLGERSAPAGDRAGDVETQLAFLGHRELIKITAIDGNPVISGEPQDLPGIRTQGEFGSLMAAIFDPQSATQFRWDRMATLSGRPAYVFSYRVPRKSGYLLEEGERSARAPFRGFVYADFETKAVMRIELECTDIPASVNYKSLELTVNYQPTLVAGAEFVLPSDFEVTAQRSKGADHVVETVKAEYQRYRRFSAESAIEFGGAKAEPRD